MIFLVGVDHLVQYNGPLLEALRQEFKNFIIDTSRKLRIELIAEEFSLEALHEIYSSTKATVHEAATMLGIDHRFCDPEEQQLRSLGIPYFAEVRDRVRRKYNITSKFILDEKIRRTVELETGEIIRSYWHLREKFWYDCIKDAMGLNILFICGHEHVDRFRELLRVKGHRCEVINSFWKREIFSDYKNINLA